MAETGGVKKLRLRRINTPSQPSPSLIQRNLEPLKENIKKKQFAQDVYYQNHASVSPLIRNQRESVHNRLGVNHLTLRKNRVQVFGTSTAALMPKPRQYNRVNLNKTQRVFSAQNRLNRIRSMQAQQIQMGDNRQKKTLRLRRAIHTTPSMNNLNMAVQDNKMRKTIKLRRSLNNGNVPEATNLTVQVRNNNFEGDNNNKMNNKHRPRRFRQILNVDLQAQIKAVQEQFEGGQPILAMKVTPTDTALTLHERFAQLT